MLSAFWFSEYKCRLFLQRLTVMCICEVCYFYTGQKTNIKLLHFCNFIDVLIHQ